MGAFILGLITWSKPYFYVLDSVNTIFLGSEPRYSMFMSSVAAVDLSSYFYTSVFESMVLFPKCQHRMAQTTFIILFE